MRVLILGGTRFVGRAVAAASLARGFDLTLLHRGRSDPGAFPGAEHVLGDRDAGGLDALRDRAFDAVVDTSAYFPQQVEAASAVRTAHYTLISSASVYRDPVAPGTDESGPVWTLGGAPPAEIDSPEAYGALKVLCERAAVERFAAAHAVRAGIVVGPRDPTDRFAHWPRRVAEGGRVLATDPAQPVQLIDARDLAAWILDAAERGVTGVHNAAGPSTPLTMGELVAACRVVTGADATPVWAGDAFLLEQGVEPWEELPLWLPRDEAGLLQLDASRARRAGLAFRPLADTIADTLAWEAERPGAARRDRLTRGRERELLARLDARV